MANKQALRDLQTRLAERMQQVRGEAAGQAWLAVDCGGHGLLFALQKEKKKRRRNGNKKRRDRKETDTSVKQ